MPSDTFTVTTKGALVVKAWDATAAYKKGDRVMHKGNGDPTWINVPFL